MRLAASILLAISVACRPSPAELDDFAERYIILALALDRHDPGFVDSYYGPVTLREMARSPELSREDILSRASLLVAELEAHPSSIRGDALLARAVALEARTEQLAGKIMRFDEESRILYGTVASPLDDETLERSRERLSVLLPGEGKLVERLRAHRQRFLIPDSKLASVLSAALEACRERTKRHLDLPGSERVELAFVENQPWAAYHYYEGDFRSRIAVNTSAGIPLHQALELVCHEGYPGHHTWAVIQELELVSGRGWLERSLDTLYGPEKLLAEGGANLGVSLVFPDDERLAFEKKVLFPMAGLDPEDAEHHHRVEAEVRKLSLGTVDIARRYLDGDWKRYQAVAALESMGVEPRPMLAFFDRYRSYVITYPWGEDLAREQVKGSWSSFRELILKGSTLPDSFERIAR